jgi:hypothetical protein
MQPRTEVELDVFSGVPNPAWALTDAESVEFGRRLSTLPRGSPAALTGKLGYRGLVVRHTHGAATRLVHVQSGHVRVDEGDTRATTAGSWSAG